MGKSSVIGYMVQKNKPITNEDLKLEYRDKFNNRYGLYSIDFDINSMESIFKYKIAPISFRVNSTNAKVRIKLISESIDIQREKYPEYTSTLLDVIVEANSIYELKYSDFMINVHDIQDIDVIIEVLSFSDTSSPEPVIDYTLEIYNNPKHRILLKEQIRPDIENLHIPHFIDDNTVDTKLEVFAYYGDMLPYPFRMVQISNLNEIAITDTIKYANVPHIRLNGNEQMLEFIITEPNVPIDSISDKTGVLYYKIYDDESSEPTEQEEASLEFRDIRNDDQFMNSIHAVYDLSIDQQQHKIVKFYFKPTDTSILPSPVQEFIATYMPKEFMEYVRNGGGRMRGVGGEFVAMGTGEISPLSDPFVPPVDQVAPLYETKTNLSISPHYLQSENTLPCNRDHLCVNFAFKPYNKEYPILFRDKYNFTHKMNTVETTLDLDLYFLSTIQYELNVNYENVTFPQDSTVYEFSCDFKNTNEPFLRTLNNWYLVNYSNDSKFIEFMTTEEYVELFESIYDDLFLCIQNKSKNASDLISGDASDNDHLNYCYQDSSTYIRNIFFPHGEGEVPPQGGEGGGMMQ